MKNKDIVGKEYKENNKKAELRYYYFNKHKYKEMRIKYSGRRKNALDKTAEETFEYLSEKTGVNLDVIKSIGKDRWPADIKICKKLGKVICNDSYAFLVPCKPDERLPYLKTEIKKVVDYLYQFIALYDMSDCYNKSMDEKRHAQDYYREQLDICKKNVDIETIYLSDEITNRINELFEDFRKFVNSCDPLNLPNSWFEANPKLKYYDPVFDIEEECSDLYNEIKENTLHNEGVKFSFIPTDEEIVARKEYFKNLRKNNERVNNSESRWYQEELTTALLNIFKKEIVKTK